MLKIQWPYLQYSPGVTVLWNSAKVQFPKAWCFHINSNGNPILFKKNLFNQQTRFYEFKLMYPSFSCKFSNSFWPDSNESSSYPKAHTRWGYKNHTLFHPVTSQSPCRCTSVSIHLVSPTPLVSVFTASYFHILKQYYSSCAIVCVWINYMMAQNRWCQAVI